MAKQIVNRINISIGITKFDIELNSPAVAIGGDSGTGKTFFLRALKASAKLGTLDFTLNWVDAGLPEVAIEATLKNAENSLIVIDNADLLLPRYGITAKTILDPANTNQYLLFSREGRRYGIPRSSIGSLVESGNVVHVQYLRQ